MSRQTVSVARSFYTSPLLLSMACLLAACNSTDALYSQGPWGPPGTRHNYPSYSQPWGYRGIESRPEELQQAQRQPAALPSDSRIISVARAMPRDIDFPEDPQPSLSTPHHMEPLQSPALQERGLAVKDSLEPAPSSVPPTAESPPGIFSAPKRVSSYAGTWKAIDDKGGACTVHLSSVTSLDLYKASASKCANENLRQVNTWSFGQDRVVLFSRGKEIARLTGSEASLSGTVGSSNLPFKMMR